MVDWFPWMHVFEDFEHHPLVYWYSCLLPWVAIPILLGWDGLTYCVAGSTRIRYIYPSPLISANYMLAWVFREKKGSRSLILFAIGEQRKRIPLNTGQ